MEDVTVRIILNPKPETDWPVEKRGYINKRGDVIEVVPASRWTRKVGNRYAMTSQMGPTLFGYIHVSGVPDAQKLKEVLLRHVQERDLPIVIGNPEKLVRRKRWRLKASALTQAQRNALLADRELNLTWAMFKPMIRYKAVFSRQDFSQDDETRELQDSDVA